MATIHDTLPAQVRERVGRHKHPTVDVLQPVLRSDEQKEFVLLLRHWVVERTFAWITQCRRFDLDYEVLPKSAEAMIYIAMTRLMMRRLAVL